MTLHKPINNKHMIHLEDKIFYGGFQGAIEALQILGQLRSTLLGGDAGLKVMTKWDGSPSICAGVDPVDGRFFVSTKSMLNKTPKVYKTEWELMNAFQGDLSLKMVECFNRLPKKNHIIQGDVMFTQGDKQRLMIDGCLYQTFHQNTLVYAAPDSSKLGMRITDCHLGIVWHTTYRGQSLDALTASYGVDLSGYDTIPYLWSHDPTIQFDRTFPNDLWQLDQMLDEIHDLLMQVVPDYLNAIATTEGAADLIEWVINDTIRNCKTRMAWEMAEEVYYQIGRQGTAAIDGVVTPRAKERHLDKYTQMIGVVSKPGLPAFAEIFVLHRKIQAAKAIVINTLNRYQSIDTFVKTPTGYKRTGAEGFVVVGQDGHACKLVDRFEFSFNNFSRDIQKGWKHPRE